MVRAVQEAVCGSQDKIEIIAEGEDKVLFNKNLLLLFSKTIRSCFAEAVLSGTVPSIIVPGLAATCVTKVEEILIKTALR